MNHQKLCIFCKGDSSFSVSEEHIVPESLGNHEHKLPPGVVCDKCNNYFASKVEQRALNTEFFKMLRFVNFIPNKKGRFLEGKIMMAGGKRPAYMRAPRKEGDAINVSIDSETFKLVRQGKVKSLIVPVETLTNPVVDDEFVSRMLAKIGYEFLAQRLLKGDITVADILAETQLDSIREYVRYNQRQENWKYHARKIYSENEAFFKDSGDSVDMVFECDFLFTKASELYFVIAFKGFEFVINMAGDSIEGYLKWLEENQNRSPLYTEEKHFGYGLTPGFEKKNRRI